jgi:hypothetical protein
VADLVLEASDLLAERGLGDAEAGGGVPEVQFLGEDDEGVELGEGEERAGHVSGVQRFLVDSSQSCGNHMWAASRSS